MNWESFSEKHLSFLNKSYLDFALSEQESLGLFSISCFFWIFKLLKQPKFSASFLLPFGSYERKVSVSVQALSHVRLFATPWTEAHQASLSITNSRSLPKLTSIESVMPSNHLILCRPLFLLPFNPSQHQGLFKCVSSLHQVAKILGVSVSTTVLLMNSQDWFPLGWTKGKESILLLFHHDFCCLHLQCLSI